MSYKVETVTPYDSKRSKTEQVREMFNSLAPGYDKMNSTFSLGIDTYWRCEALKTLKKYPHNHLLDVGTGTGDFAILANRYLKPKRIDAIDISEEMITVAEKKVKAKGLDKIIRFEHQDCAEMSYPDNLFDAVISSFGIRNFEDIDNSFKEILRVLKPGGLFMFIELTHPEQVAVKQLYNFYTKHVLQFMSLLLATEQRAYQYLPNSIGAFPQGRDMMLILKKNGFKQIRLRRLTLGVTTLYLAEK